MSDHAGGLRYGAPVTAMTLFQHLEGVSRDNSIKVDIITTDPFTLVYGVLTDVSNWPDDAVLLTVEPRNQPDRQQRVRMVAAALRRIRDSGVDMQDYDELADALVHAGVLPTRDF